MSKKMIFILIGCVIVLALVGGGAFFFLKDKGDRSETENGNAEGDAIAAKEEMELKRVNFPLENFIVNLADPGGKRYLSTRIVLELDNKESLPSLEKKVPEIRDRILMILPTKTFKEIQSVEGKVAIRGELINALNKTLNEGKITNIYFQEFVIQ